MLSWAIWGWRKKSVDVYFKKRKHFFWRRKKNVSFFLQQSSFEKPQKTLYPQLASSVAFFRKESVYLNEKKKRQKQSYFILACLSSWESFKTLLYLHCFLLGETYTFVSFTFPLPQGLNVRKKNSFVLVSFASLLKFVLAYVTWQLFKGQFKVFLFVDIVSVTIFKWPSFQ